MGCSGTDHLAGLLIYTFIQSQSVTDVTLWAASISLIEKMGVIVSVLFLCVYVLYVCVCQCVCVCGGGWVYDWEITYNAAFPSTTVLPIPHPLPHCISLTYCQMKSSTTHCIVGEEGVWVFAGCFEKLEVTGEKWPCFRLSLIRSPFYPGERELHDKAFG